MHGPVETVQILRVNGKPRVDVQPKYARTSLRSPIRHCPNKPINRGSNLSCLVVLNRSSIRFDSIQTTCSKEQSVHEQQRMVRLILLMPLDLPQAGRSCCLAMQVFVRKQVHRENEDRRQTEGPRIKHRYQALPCPTGRTAAGSDQPVPTCSARFP
jgi:hypothetical protein